MSDFKTEHMHSWSKDWSSDDKYHWHDCDEAACPITDNSEKEGMQNIHGRTDPMRTSIGRNAAYAERSAMRRAQLWRLADH